MNRLRLVAGLLALICWPTVSVGQAVPDTERLLARVRILTAPELAGRGSGTPESLATADTLVAWLADAGLVPAFDGRWWQEFALRGTGWAGDDLAGRIDRNVAGILPGSGDLASRFIVVGAHYDHLGRVEPASGATSIPGPTEYYPGANDNASGVTVVCELVELMRVRQTNATDRRSVLVVFFGAEEVGLQGSGYFVTNPPIDLTQIDAMLNFDTVGQISDNRIYVSGVGTTPAFGDLVQAANADELEITIGQGGWSGSDHMSFNTREVPVLFIFGGPYRQYNRPADTWDMLTPDGLVQVTMFSDRLLAELRSHRDNLPWVMVAEKQLQSGDQTEQNRDTWFGSLPDFTEDVTGYLLAGVFDDSPAAEAGLEKGDLLVGMAGQPITDLASFTQLLRSHLPGQLVAVDVLREGHSLQFTVVLGSRKERQ